MFLILIPNRKQTHYFFPPAPRGKEIIVAFDGISSERAFLKKAKKNPADKGVSAESEINCRLFGENR